MRGHDEAFVEFVEARGTALLRTAYLLTSDVGLAEDLVQGALVKTYLAWGRLERPEAAEAYARKVVANDCASWWRRKSNRLERPVAVLPESRSTDAVDILLERTILLNALQQLTPRQRCVLVLRFYEDLSEAEIAGVLGMATGTVKSHASRGLARLNDLLGPDRRNSISREIRDGKN